MSTDAVGPNLADDEILTGEVTRLVRVFPETGYTILNLVASNKLKATVVGILPGVSVGDHLELTGHWETHVQYGRQFNVATFVEHRGAVAPAAIEDLVEYLSSDTFYGIGPVLASRIVEAFGTATLDVLEQHPDRLSRVPGIGRQRATAICEAWRTQRPVQGVMTFLRGHGLSSGLAARIYQQYKEQSEAIIRQNPYQLIDDISGVGFKTADELAQRLGLAQDSPERLRAGLVYTLDRFTLAGHVYMPQREWLDAAADLLQVQDAALVGQIKPLTTSGKIKVIEPENTAIIYPALLFRHETTVAARLKAIQQASSMRVFDVFKTLDLDQSIRATMSAELPLSDDQRIAICTVLTGKVTVITGGAGTGKTSLVQSLLALCERYGVRVALCAPTGRAAKRLAEATSRPTKTIHRTLEWSGGAESGRFGRNGYFPLDIDLLIVDEASMLDLPLASHLLDAVPNRAHVLLMGDVDQLPPVGVGNVLRDLIDSDLARVIRLNTIFRQAEHSLIVTNAHRINCGELPIFPADAQDSFFFKQEDPKQAAALIVDLVQRRIPGRFGFSPRDIMVLSPIHRGEAGEINLNSMLQSALNPASAKTVEHTFGAKVFRVGDRVMQLTNNYALEVFNGDTGTLTQIDADERTLTVDIDGRPIKYKWAEHDQLGLAFAVTVHKAQGSEYPVVIIPVLMQQAILLQRNLLYTALTRARKLAVLVGTERALAFAVSNNPTMKRNSRLAERLRSGS